MKSLKMMALVAGLGLAVMCTAPDFSFAQGRGWGGGACARYGSGVQGGGGKWQKGQRPGSATGSAYTNRTCDGTGPKGRAYLGGGRRGATGAGQSGTGQSGAGQ
jgi:hypothetical protein